ncbi:MAG TPA: hypothetical protein VHZ76_00780 [Gammaproteobacteria bacterium]|jgi:transposase-like protein|nr:hypothetical protein [Gammaproteobacteria bacterium]
MTTLDPSQMMIVYDGVAYPCVKIPDVANVNTKQVLSNGDMLIISRISRKDLPFDAYDNVKESQQKLDKAITSLSSKRQRLTPEEREKIADMYVKREASTKEIAKMFHTTRANVYAIVNLLGKSRKKMKGSRNVKDNIRKEVRAAYKSKQATVVELAKKYNVTPSRIYQYLRT